MRNPFIYGAPAARVRFDMNCAETVVSGGFAAAGRSQRRRREIW